MPEPRTIRVYLCSTFSDMRAERQYLHSVVLPQLQTHGEPLGVRVELIDLLKDLASADEADDPRRLKECLDGVSTCSIFVALLGNRYGKPLDSISADALAAYPWLSRCAGQSRYAIEIASALLADTQLLERCFFYSRDARFLNDVPPPRRGDWEAETPAAAAKLAELKAAIPASGRTVRQYTCQWNAGADDLTGFGDLATLVVEDLRGAMSGPTLTTATHTEASLLDQIIGATRAAPEQAERCRGHEVLIEDAPDGARREEGGPAVAEPKEFPPRSGERPPLTGAAVGLPTPTRPQPYLDENVQFTVYRPQTVKPLTWATLLVFAHLSERRPDAAADEPDPVAEVQRQAQQLLGEQFAAYRDVTEDSTQAVPREGELTFVPEMEGVEFNPKRRSFLWEESVHREEFRMRAAADMDGRTARGRLTVFLGDILLAEVSLSVRVDSRGGAVKLEAAHAVPYRKIFPSYSHKDEAIVTQVERYAQTLGDEYLRDVTHLRSGEVWNERLEAFIRDADVFQLFWSSNSMRSPYVRQEWEYALALSRSNFIRPTYWENPLPSSPGEDLPPAALTRLHFQRLLTAATAATTEAAAPQATQPLAAPEPAAAPGPAAGRRRMRSSYAAGLVVMIGASALLAFNTMHLYTYTASPAPPPPPISARIVVRSISFDAQRAAIRPDALPLLEEDLAMFKSANLAVVIAGHADSSEASAVALAQRRAAAVRDYLVAHGIPASRIRVEGFGDSRPVASNETAEGRAQNRRVDFRLMPAEDLAAHQ